MAKLHVTDKAQRMLTLLLGIRFPDVRAAVARVGYGPEQVREGWSLLMAAAGDRLDVPPGMSMPKDDGTLAALDDWENQWFPVIDATLKYNLPEHHATVFQGLTQTSGAELLVTLPKLLARIASLPADAKELLARRQVTEAELSRAAALITKLTTSTDAVPAEPVDPTEAQKALEEAETKMWRHYLEWSQIIRAQVKRPRYLQLMGFGTGTRKKSPTEPEAYDDERGTDDNLIP